MGLVIVAAGESSTDPIPWLVNYGVAGVVILLLVTGQLRTKSEVGALEKRVTQQDDIIKAKDIALEALTNQLVSIVPQLAKVGDVVEALPQNTSAALTHAMSELTSKLDDIQQGR